MAPVRKSRLPLLALIALCILPGLSVFASLPWLKQQSDGTIYLLTGLAAVLTIAASLALAILHDRKLDEWERSNSRFSSFWGDAVGTSLVALLLAVPPGRDWIVSVVSSWSGTPDAGSKVIIIAVVFGFIATVMARAVCMTAFSLGWSFWKLRTPRGAA